MISMLTDIDRLSIVTFGSDSKVVLAPTQMSANQRTNASRLASEIQVDGATFLSGGLMKGIDQLHLCNRDDSVKSVLLYVAFCLPFPASPR